jgi:hypothetical protein
VPVFADAVGTEVIPRAAYFHLEELIQKLRLCVMHAAGEIARRQNTEKISREHVERALVEIASSGISNLDDFEQSQRALAHFSPDTYVFLEKRLQNLRMKLVQWGVKYAREDGRTGEVVIAESEIDRAWNTLGAPEVLPMILAPPV